MGKVEVKTSVFLTKYHAMKTYGGVDVQQDAFLTSATNVEELSASRLGRFNLRVRAPVTH
jgi:hypothetical protein